MSTSSCWCNRMTMLDPFNTYKFKLNGELHAWGPTKIIYVSSPDHSFEIYPKQGSPLNSKTYPKRGFHSNFDLSIEKFLRQKQVLGRMKKFTLFLEIVNFDTLNVVRAKCIWWQKYTLIMCFSGHGYTYSIFIWVCHQRLHSNGKCDKIIIQFNSIQFYLKCDVI